MCAKNIWSSPLNDIGMKKLTIFAFLSAVSAWNPLEWLTPTRVNQEQPNERSRSDGVRSGSLLYAPEEALPHFDDENPFRLFNNINWNEEDYRQSCAMQTKIDERTSKFYSTLFKVKSIEEVERICASVTYDSTIGPVDTAIVNVCVSFGRGDTEAFEVIIFINSLPGRICGEYYSDHWITVQGLRTHDDKPVWGNLPDRVCESKLADAIRKSDIFARTSDQYSEDTPIISRIKAHSRDIALKNTCQIERLKRLAVRTADDALAVSLKYLVATTIPVTVPARSLFGVSLDNQMSDFKYFWGLHVLRGHVNDRTDDDDDHHHLTS